MGRSKLRANKRPPPKLRPPLPPSSPPHSHPHPLPLPDPSSDPTTFSAALSSWSASAFGRLDHLPKLTQSQLSALTGAAAGIGEANFLSDPGALGALSAAAAGAGAGVGAEMGAGGIPIDLPASLAALFEAKLTLDREKAKLLRMQQELRGQREGRLRLEEQVELVREKQVMLLEEECTCGHHHSYAPEPSASEHDECDYECEEDCECDCHSYTDEYEECGHDHDYHLHSHSHGHGHGHGGHVHRGSYDEDEDLEYNPAHVLEPEDDEIDEHDEGKRPLAEDPERLDETVRELFNWIKAVVWTIEQAAIVSGRRNWTQPE
ncbi:hypothetical protein IAT38_008313 [Cryptococcus sp. DSM 104549]